MVNNSNPKESLVIGSQLRRARDLLQFTREEVAEVIGVHIQDIGGWEEEKLRPNLKQLETLAKLYGREMDYFLRVTPAPPEHIEFRGKPGQSLKGLSKETKIVLARFDELCRTVLELENFLNKKREVKLPRFKESDQPKIVAETLRKKFNIDDKPLLKLRDFLENAGVRTFELPVPGDEFSGFSFWHSEYGPCILLNANEKPEGRKNFTLAHELAHLLYNHGSSLCYIPLKLHEIYRGLEYKTNQTAIELLLPEVGVIQDFKKRGFSRTPSEKELAQMAYAKWGVSIQALGYRLENLDLIEKGYTDKLWETKQYYKGKKGPRTPKWEKQLGKQFVGTSIEAYQKGFISVGKLASSLGITVRRAIEQIEKRAK